MYRHIRAQDRFFKDFGWLKAFWLFSFGNYRDPDNAGFGTLRVFNHDTVGPQSGFPTHPHDNMEIVTIVLEGELTHEDNTGGKGTITPSKIQRMTAGTGVMHSEFNLTDQPCRLCQIWFLPDRQDHEPGYSEHEIDPADWSGRILPIAEPDGSAPIKLNADAMLYRSHLSAGDSVSYAAAEGRGVIIYLLQGEMEVNGNRLTECDQLRVTDETGLDFTVTAGADFILIDVPV